MCEMMPLECDPNYRDVMFPPRRDWENRTLLARKFGSVDFGDLATLVLTENRLFGEAAEAEAVGNGAQGLVVEGARWGGAGVLLGWGWRTATHLSPLPPLLSPSFRSAHGPLRKGACLWPGARGPSLHGGLRCGGQPRGRGQQRGA